jgi:hypothetical protein
METPCTTDFRRQASSDTTPAKAMQNVRQNQGLGLKQVAFGLVSLGLVLMTVLPAFQVLEQALAPELVPTPLTCREGTASLYRATERARRGVLSDVLRPEREALDSFRAALDPEWRHHEAIFQKCQLAHDKIALDAFRTVVFLRYAEERAVRAESLDLARLRVTAPKLVEGLR